VPSRLHFALFPPQTEAPPNLTPRSLAMHACMPPSSMGPLYPPRAYRTRNVGGPREEAREVGRARAPRDARLPCILEPCEQQVYERGGARLRLAHAHEPDQVLGEL
jgi:hypothetical protein